MKRSTARILSIVSAVVVVLICLAFIPSGNKLVTTGVFIIYLPFAIYLNYCQRCPHCGAWPRKGSFFDEYCPRCGEPLDD